MSLSTYFVVSNETGTILAVYPHGHLSDAQEFARRTMAQAGRAFNTFVHTISIDGPPPVVGASISMAGVFIPEPDGALDFIGGQTVERKTGKPYVPQMYHAPVDQTDGCFCPCCGKDW